MAGERQKGDRVTFERGIPAHMMGIDGTWRRDCTMEDVSETGAKLTVEGSVEGLHLKEFFLLLSSTGLAYRRCELSWVNGDQIGVNFLKQGDKKKKMARLVISNDYGLLIHAPAKSLWYGSRQLFTGPRNFRNVRQSQQSHGSRGRPRPAHAATDRPSAEALGPGGGPTAA